jgi:hypothetical protein
MLQTQQNIEVSEEEMAVIEAALHTQSKILHVQASAGGNKARERLNQVKRVLARLTQQKSKQTPERPRSGFNLFCTSGDVWLKPACKVKDSSLPCTAEGENRE